MRPIDITTFVSRTHDISPLKQSEDSKPIVQQHTLTQNIEKQIDNRMVQVVHKENSEFESPLDKDGRSKNLYQQNSNQNKKKKEEDGKVSIKNKKRANFDIKL